MFVALALAAIAQTANLEVWEKQIAPGLAYREEIDVDAPRMIHVLRFTPGSATSIACELAGGSIYKADAVKGRGTVSDLIKRPGAIAAINGDFFPFTGDPLGLMVHEGKLLSTPYQVHATPFVTRPAFFWSGSKSGFAGRLRFSGTCAIADGPAQALDGWNQECGRNQVCLDTSTASLALAKAPNVIVVMKVSKWSDGVDGQGEGQVRGIFTDQTNVPVPEGNIALVANGSKVAQLAMARVGAPIRLRWRVEGLPFAPEEAIGGGPMLVRNGRLAVDAREEGFDATFSDKHHPRTAIGRRSDGELWFVAVDGRQKMSDGMSLPQLARWFLDHGCTDAMNLDGGGSTAINLLGALVNRPSEGAERPVANGVVFYGPRPGEPATGLKISNPEPGVLKVTTAGGEEVPNAEVVWACQGAAWVDQGGVLHPVSIGTATVTALSRGVLLTRSIPVQFH